MQFFVCTKTRALHPATPRFYVADGTASPAAATSVATSAVAAARAAGIHASISPAVASARTRLENVYLITMFFINPLLLRCGGTRQERDASHTCSTSISATSLLQRPGRHGIKPTNRKLSANPRISTDAPPTHDAAPDRNNLVRGFVLAFAGEGAVVVRVAVVVDVLAPLPRRSLSRHHGSRLGTRVVASLPLRRKKR